jgi:hypothetical protein
MARNYKLTWRLCVQCEQAIGCLNKLHAALIITLSLGVACLCFLFLVDCVRFVACRRRTVDERIVLRSQRSHRSHLSCCSISLISLQTKESVSLLTARERRTHPLSQSRCVCTAENASRTCIAVRHRAKQSATVSHARARACRCDQPSASPRRPAQQQ